MRMRCKGALQFDVGSGRLEYKIHDTKYEIQMRGFAPSFVLYVLGAVWCVCCVVFLSQLIGFIFYAVEDLDVGR